MNIAARKRHDEVAEVEGYLYETALEFGYLEYRSEVLHHRVCYIVGKTPHNETYCNHDEREQITDAVLMEKSVLLSIRIHVSISNIWRKINKISLIFSTFVP